MRQYWRNTDGFTYVELLTGMVLTVLLLTAIFGLLAVSLGSWQTGSRKVEVEQTARIGLDAIVRELRYEAAEILSAGDNSLQFRNQTGETVEFFQHGNTLSRRLVIGSVPQKSQPVAGSGDIIVTPSFQVADVAADSPSVLRGNRIVTVTIAVSSADGRYSFILESAIIPLNT